MQLADLAAPTAFHQFKLKIKVGRREKKKNKNKKKAKNIIPLPSTIFHYLPLPSTTFVYIIIIIIIMYICSHLHPRRATYLNQARYNNNNNNNNNNNIMCMYELAIPNSSHPSSLYNSPLHTTTVLTVQRVRRIWPEPEWIISGSVNA